MPTNGNDKVDATLVKQIGTNLYFMVKNSHDLHPCYEAVESFSDVPFSVLNLLNMPKTAMDNFSLLSEEEQKNYNNIKKISEYSKSIKKILNKEMRKKRKKSREERRVLIEKKKLEK